MSLISVENEKELLLQVAKGNQKAFAELFFAYHIQIAEFVILLTDSEELTKEIVQDVFVKIWMDRQSLHTINKFLPYLFIVTRNYTLNCIRKSVADRQKKQTYGLHLVHVSGDEHSGVEEDLHYNLELVDRAVAQLPPQQQKVFKLKREGKKNNEIANELQISVDSVKKYQQWAIKSVAQFVKNHQELSLFLIVTGIIRK